MDPTRILLYCRHKDHSIGYIQKESICELSSVGKKENGVIMIHADTGDFDPPGFSDTKSVDKAGGQKKDSDRYRKKQGREGTNG